MPQKLLVRIWKADFIIGNNVLAHVPDINDFIKGIDFCLKKMELQYLSFLMHQ